MYEKPYWFLKFNEGREGKRRGDRIRVEEDEVVDGGIFSVVLLYKPEHLRH